MLNSIVQTSIDIPEDIVSKIYEIKQHSSVVGKRSNVGGWQSKQFTSYSEVPWAEDLIQRCLHNLDLSVYRLHQYWFNISPPKAYHKWHSHGGVDQVAVCYISIPKNSGNIEFRQGDIIEEIEPVNGMLITLPGGIDHRVLENKSAEDRITLAFNLKSKG